MKIFYITLLFVVIAHSGFSQTVSTQSTWTKEYEESVYNWADNSLNLAFTSDSVKKHYLTILVQKFKRELPNGLNSVSQDSLSKIIVKLDKESKKEINYDYLRKWSPGFEAVFKKSIHDRLNNSFSENIKNKICNCMISQYKKIYPVGMPGEVPTEIGDKTVGKCAYEAIHNNR